MFSGIKLAGRYNVDFAGKSYDMGKCYEMVNFDLFDKNSNPVGARKTLYFRSGKGLMATEFTMEAEADRYMSYPDNCKFSVKAATAITVERR